MRVMAQEPPGGRESRVGAVLPAHPKALKFEDFDVLSSVISDGDLQRGASSVSWNIPEIESSWRDGYFWVWLSPPNNTCVVTSMELYSSCMVWFEWDDAKAKTNERKHGVRFDDAMLAFSDPYALVEQDRIESEELRWQPLV